MTPVIGKKEEPNLWTAEAEIPILTKPSGGIKAKIELVKKGSFEGPILKSPKILYQIGVRLEKNGFIGDLENKLNVFIAGTTKDFEINERLCVIITAESGVGKSWLLRILELYFGDDVHSYSRISACAPDYWGKVLKNGTLNGEILIIKQMEGSDKGNYSLMIMADPISGGLKLLTLNEKKKIEELSLPGMPVIGTSSVNIQIDPQMFRRFLDVHPDESEEQTKRILRHELRLKCDALYKRDCESVDLDLKEIVDKMKYESKLYGVEIPYAMLIEDKIPPVILSRTDIKKVIGLTSAITHLYFQQRLRYVNPVWTEVLLSSPADHYYMYRLLESILSKRLSGISDNRTTKLLTTMKIVDPNNSGLGTDLLQASTGYPKPTIWAGMTELNRQGFVVTEDDPTNKKNNIYKRTNKTEKTVAITFPDEVIEKEYIKFVKEKLGKYDEKSDKKHVLSSEQTDLLRKSLLVFDIETGRNITKEIISEKTFKEYKLEEVSV